MKLPTRTMSWADPASFTAREWLVMSHLQNTTRVTYRLGGDGGPATLTLRPAVHFRGHDAPVDAAHPERYLLSASGDRFELLGGRDLPPLRLTLRDHASAFTLDA